MTSDGAAHQLSSTATLCQFEVEPAKVATTVPCCNYRPESVSSFVAAPCSSCRPLDTHTSTSVLKCPSCAQCALRVLRVGCSTVRHSVHHASVSLAAVRVQESGHRGTAPERHIEQVQVSCFGPVHQCGQVHRVRCSLWPLQQTRLRVKSTYFCEQTFSRRMRTAFSQEWTGRLCVSGIFCRHHQTWVRLTECVQCHFLH